MSVLKRKIEAATGPDDVAALRRLIPVWLHELALSHLSSLTPQPGWTISLEGAEWIGADRRHDNTAACLVHGYGPSPHASTFMVYISPEMSGCLSAIALGQDSFDKEAKLTSFDLHVPRIFADGLRMALADIGIDMSNWVSSMTGDGLKLPLGAEYVLQTHFVLQAPDNGPWANQAFNLYMELAGQQARKLLLALRRQKPSMPDEDSQFSQQCLKDRLGSYRLSLRAVAARPTLTVADCTRLFVGQTIDLPGIYFDNIALSVDQDGSSREKSGNVARARLGVEQGRKVVMLNGPLSPSFLDGLSNADGMSAQAPDAFPGPLDSEFL